MEHEIKILSSLNEIESKYKAFIIDIWGVLWDGIEPYDYSINSLKKLISSKKQIILLSNAPRRAKVVSKRLSDIGIDNTLYNKIISSGEICRIKFLQSKNNISKYKNIYYFIGQPADQTITENLNLKETKNMNEASFILVCGTRKFEDTLDIYKYELDLGLELNLPLICANPDKLVVRKSGEFLICAGKMAEYYSSKGGIVFKYGKPFKDAYQMCLEHILSINQKLTKKDILCIGDSLDTDILGANNFGINSLLISNGIHKNDLNFNGLLLPKLRLESFLRTKKIFPNYVLRNFIF